MLLGRKFEPFPCVQTEIGKSQKAQLPHDVPSLGLELRI